MKHYVVSLWMLLITAFLSQPLCGASVQKGKYPLVSRVSAPFAPTNGLLNRHIALWQSHGYYYESKLTRWEWQRARIFQTVEDLYTQSYVLPFLVPMLENAGANVLLPRERDTNTTEVVVDNDGCLTSHSLYAESNTQKSWMNGEGLGFAHLRTEYRGFENPFKEGTYRKIESVKRGEESVAEWIPEIKTSGTYAVYVSYQTLPNSAEDALYTIHHRGRKSQFKVNQRMGGGTWIYLGHFAFEAGKPSENRVTLSNRSRQGGRVITADAVKVGGGYGNIARRISEEALITENVTSSSAETSTIVKKLPKIDYPWEVSGYPRFTEAARYWMQWAGVPDSVYSESHGLNDYTDDYKARGKWVNYLIGGSEINPEEEGLHIPVDMAFAFHTDAGTTWNDSIIGTLGICETKAYDGVFPNGTSRSDSRQLTDWIMKSIVSDIRAKYEPRWSSRGVWDKSYYEARVPQVPTMLLELLSHQNFADMRYGLDPRFRFTVSRAIYKGMLRFLCARDKIKCVVQPLPVDQMSLRFLDREEVELTWQSVEDELEPTAHPDKYIVYTRIDNGDFDAGVVVKEKSYRGTQIPGKIYSYKVTAINEGGESFPSEILSAGRAEVERGLALVVNGFDRVSAPADFVSDSIAGFYDALDHGVPYKQDISYIGTMTEFRRKIPWMDDDAAGFGASRSDYETQVIAGNSFDYPALHGAALLASGYSFTSCSDESVERKVVSLEEYQVVDWFLGKERQSKMGRGGVVPLEFKTFTKVMQEAIAAYTAQGGNILITGANVASDLWDTDFPLQADKEFAMNVLKYKWRTDQAATTGRIKAVASLYPSFKGNYTYYNELNAESYVVESPDALEPAAEGAYTIFRYTENNLSAGVAYRGTYSSCVLGFPFESIRTAEQRAQLMNQVITFFNHK